MSRRSNTSNDSPQRGITFFNPDDDAHRGANYAENWYAANTLLKKRWQKIVAGLIALGLIIGTVDNLLLTISARADARARIVYHPIIGAMGAERYNELTRHLIMYIAFLVIAAVIIGVVLYKKWQQHQENKKYLAFAEANRKADSLPIVGTLL